MNLVPLLVILFPHERPRDRDMGPDRWDRRVVGECPTGGLGIRLGRNIHSDMLCDMSRHRTATGAGQAA